MWNKFSKTAIYLCGDKYVAYSTFYLLYCVAYLFDLSVYN